MIRETFCEFLFIWQCRRKEKLIKDYYVIENVKRMLSERFVQFQELETTLQFIHFTHIQFQYLKLSKFESLDLGNFEMEIIDSQESVLWKTIFIKINKKLQENEIKSSRTKSLDSRSEKNHSCRMQFIAKFVWNKENIAPNFLWNISYLMNQKFKRRSEISNTFTYIIIVSLHSFEVWFMYLLNKITTPLKALNSDNKNPCESGGGSLYYLLLVIEGD